MPRRLKGSTGGYIFHVMNRGVRKLPLFNDHNDYRAFARVLCEAYERLAMRILAWVLMPNHWHLVLWPSADGDLTEFVGWASLTHACRWQRIHETRGTGPVYQGRFKPIPVEIGVHLLTVLRYVERNPVRAGLVSHAADWPWSSAATNAKTPSEYMPALHAWPIDKPPRWLDIVDEPESDLALAEVRKCVERSSPYGSEAWTNEAVKRIGWIHGLRDGGRPPGKQEDNGNANQADQRPATGESRDLTGER